jgi:hypothetical protein
MTGQDRPPDWVIRSLFPTFSVGQLARRYGMRRWQVREALNRTVSHAVHIWA